MHKSLTLWTPLFNQDEASHRFGVRIQGEDGMPCGPGAGERIKHDPVGRAPDRDKLAEKLEGLDSLKAVLVTYDGREFGGTIAGAPRFLIGPRGTSQLVCQRLRTT